MYVILPGKVSGSDTNHTGTIEIPNLSDENEPTDVDVCLICIV